MFSKTNYKRVVWLIVSIGVANGIAVASTQAPRCKHIGPFYGGEVHYFGDRELWTFAFYWCNGGYHLSPSNVKYSECTDDLEWDPTPPQCFQMANVYVPENGYYRGNKSNLLHGESYVIECKDKYEMFSEEDGFINFGSLRTRNNNGSLEPAVPKCLEKRCDPADQYKSIVKYPNGVRATSNVLSQTTVKLECEQGFDYYRDNAPMETPVMRKCVKGNIENAPVCEEARCLVPGYLRNTDTQYRNYRTNSVLVDGHYMRPNNKLEVVCVNEADYELFVNSTGKYLESFTSDCRFGLFDREAEEFPICLEKRCDPADQYKTFVKYPNGLRVTSKILSQTTVKLECEPGYDYYRGNTPMETPVMRKCVKGNIENAPVCEEARCLVSGYPKNKDTQYRYYQTNYVLVEGRYMRPNNKLEVVCVNEADYELFVNSTGKYLKSFTSECRFGLFDREADEFPICLEKQCDLADQNKAIVKYTNGSRVTSKILSRTTVTLECEQGYDFYMGNKPMETPITRMCIKGNIENSPVCEEAIFCPEVSSLRHGRTFQDSSDGMRNAYQSVTKYICNSGYMLEGNNGQDSRECQANGTWSGEEPECTPPRCKDIGPFYGGAVQYFGDRERWTFAFYRCNEGYHLSPSTVKRSECSNELEWDPTPPQCLPILCPEVSSLRYGRTFQDSSDGMRNDYRSVTKYICNSGYMLEGNNGQDSRKCQADGTWSGKEPECTPILCPEVPSIRYGRTFQDSSDGMRNVYQSVMKYTCNSGYMLEGNNGQDSRECQADGTWSGEEPKCTTPRCKHIDPFYGGDVQYFGDRERWTFAFYRCNEGYQLSPSNVKRSECTDDLEWDPTPPQCFQMAKVYIPENGYYRGNKDNLLHGESYTIACKNKYEMHSEEDGFIKWGSLRIRNNNGSLEPIVPKCLEKRCDPADQYKTIVKNPNGVRVTSKILSRTTVTLECEQGYEFYMGNKPMETPVTRMCVKGNIENAPVCEEGRCIFKPSQHACFTTNEIEDCISGEFKASKTTSVTIKCREGYTLYLSKDGTSKHVKDEVQVTCLKGAYFQGYRCIPDSKVQAIQDYFFKIKYKNKQGFETLLDRFTCSSSLFGSNFCEDPCLVPDVQFGFAKNEFGDRVSMEVVHGTQITIGCDNGYDPSEKVTTTCKSGDWDIEQFPFCVPKPCHISLNLKTFFWVNSTQLTIGDGIKRTFRNGTKIEMSCTNGFEMTDLSTGKTVNKSRKDIVCIFGKWSKKYNCKAAQCSVPQVKNAVLKTKSADKYDHWSKVRLRCVIGHHFNEKNPNNIRRVFKAQCRFGKWSRSIPAKCRPDSCHLKIHEGSSYYYNRDLIETSTRFPHGTHVGLQCLENFDTFDEEGNIIDIYPNVTCYQGIWKNMYTCKKRCDPFNGRNGESMYKVENISMDQAVLHGQGIMVSCAGYQENDFELKCDNGEWKGYVDCNDKKNITNAGDFLENGCLLPSDKKFSFRDDNDNDVPVGSLVESGTTLTVRCANIDYYDILTSYDYYDAGTNGTTITCTGTELSRFDLDCPDVGPDSCMELPNGIVKKVFNKYYISCEEGFSLNLIKQENAEGTCQHGRLKSTIGHTDPKCIPNDCVLPHDIDDKLSVKDRSRYLSLSPGSTVTSGDHVFLNCSEVSEHIYEPLNRQFKCVEGQWIEDEKDPNWKFGNNGTFPKCREAKCEPNCANEGVCYKDDHCKCKRLTEGKRCEIVWCDEQCTENGGECVADGKCVCPKGRYGPSCEKKSCRLPENSAKPKEPRIMYNIGETLKNLECEFGNILDSKDSMTCQEDGSWSNVVSCVKSVFYLISVKTDDTGWTGGAGTDAHVYIYLHGQSGNTNKINLIGNFENDDLDETRVEEKDIRPITGITIGHDGEGFKPDWLLKFVSIYVESMNEYYVFRYDNSVWVTASKDVTLPIEDNCVNTFDKGHDWNPIWRKIRPYFIGQNLEMSLRACLQKCTELEYFRCMSVLYLRLMKICWGLSADNENYFYTNQKNWDSLIYRRSCKNISEKIPYDFT